MGKNKEEAAGTHDLTPMIPGRPEKILVPVTGDSVVVISESGKVSYLVLADGKFELRQSFTPFGDLANSHINVANFIFGDVSIAFASDSGENRIFSLFYPEGGKERLFGLTHEFPNLGASPVLLVSTLRNKAFAILGVPLLRDAISYAAECAIGISKIPELRSTMSVSTLAS